MTSAWLHNGYVVYSYYRIHRVSSPVILQRLPSYYRLEFCLSEVHWGSHLSRGLRALELVRSRGGCSSVGWCCSTGVGSAGVSGSAGSGVFGFLVLRLSIFECVLFLILLRCVLCRLFSGRRCTLLWFLRTVTPSLVISSNERGATWRWTCASVSLSGIHTLFPGFSDLRLARWRLS